MLRWQISLLQFQASRLQWSNRRLAALCLLYRKRAADHEYPGLSLLDLEGQSGFTREELGFAMWSLCEKGMAKVDDRTHYGITAAGVDFVENGLKEEHADLRMIAAVQIPQQPEQASGPIHL